jgi:CRP-like cAMP-binding protein
MAEPLTSDPRIWSRVLLPVSGFLVDAAPGLRANRLLALLPDADLERLARRLSFIDLRHHDVLYDFGDDVDSAYFPLSSVISVIPMDSDGRGVEAASVGCEGLVGLSGLLGGGGMMTGQTIAQVSGGAARIEVVVLRDELARHEGMSRVVDRYIVAFLGQVSQSLVCNRHHPLERRAVRWLLATHDRVVGDHFVLTQDFLALMLGVTRPQVSQAAAELRRRGLIDYRRGRIEIRDRPGLEASSCDCYGIIRDEFERLLADPRGYGWRGVGG